jgi:hypothetical protein
VGKYIYILWYAEESYETLRIEIWESFYKETVCNVVKYRAQMGRYHSWDRHSTVVIPSKSEVTGGGVDAEMWREIHDSWSRQAVTLSGRASCLLSLRPSFIKAYLTYMNYLCFSVQTDFKKWFNLYQLMLKFTCYS